jgi:hypothetical protein
MIDTLSVFLGLFLLAAISSNKELTKKDENGNHSDVYVWLVLSLVLNLVLCGLGFLYPSRGSLRYTNIAVPLWFFTAAITASTKGPIKVISRIAWVAFLAFVVIGPFPPF